MGLVVLRVEPVADATVVPTAITVLLGSQAGPPWAGRIMPRNHALTPTPGATMTVAKNGEPTCKRGQAGTSGGTLSDLLARDIMRYHTKEG